jgi:hypothetical protein
MWREEGDKLLQRYPSPEGNRWIDLYQQRDGQFYFQEFSEDRGDTPNYGSGTYAAPGWKSGLYRRAEAAESDRKMAPWLCEDST